MKKMMIFLAFVGLGLTTQVDVEAHNGYSHKKKTTQRAQARKHAYRAVMHRAQAAVAHDVAYAPAPAPEVEDAVPAGSRTCLGNTFSIKKALVISLLLISAHQAMTPPDEELFLQPRVAALWPSIAERIGLPQDFPIAAGTLPSHMLCDPTGIRDMNIHIGKDVGNLPDDVLAFVIGHEATHAKHDCNELGSAMLTTCAEMLSVGHSHRLFFLPDSLDEQEIIAQFEQVYLAAASYEKSMDPVINKAFIDDAAEEAVIVSCAMNRLKEFLKF